MKYVLKLLPRLSSIVSQKAQVTVDIPNKIVNVETLASVDIIKGAIAQAGHECAD